MIRQIRFDDLKPLCSFGEVRCYGPGSFRGINNYVTVIPPVRPAVVEADIICIEMPGTRRYENIGRGRVLVFHGASVRGEWRQLAPPHMRVADVISGVNRYVDLAFVGVCNPGGHLLDREGGVSLQNYFGSEGKCIITKGDRLSVALAGNIIFRKGERYRH